MYKNRNLEGIKSLGYKKITKLFMPSLCSAADYGQRNRQSSFSYGKKSKNRVYKSRPLTMGKETDSLAFLMERKVKIEFTRAGRTYIIETGQKISIFTYKRRKNNA